MAEKPTSTAPGAESPRSRRLAQSTSPYLRQHADNPVDWYEWGPQALRRAVDEDKPILLSVGYSACHWCHVMAHESFEDEAVAAVMNEHFVNIKVDREERPDIDAIYQKVPLLMGQGGGWPLTVFLTPDGRPFYGGTYFPPRPGYGRPSFVQVLGAVSELYRTRREDVVEQCDAFMGGFTDIAGAVERMTATGSTSDAIEAARAAAKLLIGRIDPQWGGLGDAPKFPNPTALDLLHRVARSGDDAVAEDAAAAVRLTLERMWRGGIYDHLRGGFARYAVDREWLVPHFEKMLYDNVLLLPLYAEAAVTWPDDGHLRDVVEQTLAYLEQDMRAPDGTFYASTDADSEGEEGKYFCWTPAEVEEVLGADAAAVFNAVYGVTPGGNFEHGRSILHLSEPLDARAQQLGLSRAQLDAQLADARTRLLARRGTRVPPHRDDKIVTSWNALLISGLCRTACALAALGDDDRSGHAVGLARDAAEVLWERHVDADGRVLRASFGGRAHTPGVLDDVAFLGRAFLDLHEVTLAPRWLDAAEQLAARLLAQHVREGGGFHLTAADAESLIERTESVQDSAIPSGTGIAIELLLRLDAAGRGPAGARGAAEAALARLGGAAAQPFAFASVLLAAGLADPRAAHVTLRADAPTDPGARAWAAAICGERLRDPHAVTLSFVVEEGADASAVVCRGQVCTAPLREIAAIRRSLHKAS